MINFTIYGRLYGIGEYFYHAPNHQSYSTIDIFTTQFQLVGVTDRHWSITLLVEK